MSENVIAVEPDTIVLAELRRELKMRHHVYPGQVSKGRLSQPNADRRIRIIEQLVREYEDRVQMDMFG